MCAGCGSVKTAIATRAFRRPLCPTCSVSSMPRHVVQAITSHSQTAEKFYEGELRRRIDPALLELGARPFWFCRIVTERLLESLWSRLLDSIRFFFFVYIGVCVSLFV